jgi:hypothetical protein
MAPVARIRKKGQTVADITAFPGKLKSLRYELEPFASTGREASHIVEELFDAIIVTLRRDRRFAGVPLRDFDLLLADVHADAERRLSNQLRDRVHLDDVDFVDGVEP